MSNKNMLDISLMQLADAASKLLLLTEKVENLEQQLAHLSLADDDKFIPIEDAAKKLNKSVSAIRQRLKHPRKPMRKGVVWKQEDKGCAIFVNVKRFREQM